MALSAASTNLGHGGVSENLKAQGVGCWALVRLRGPLGRNSVNLKVYRFGWLKAEAFLFAALADLGLKVKGLGPGFRDF